MGFQSTVHCLCFYIHLYIQYIQATYFTGEVVLGDYHRLFLAEVKDDGSAQTYAKWDDEWMNAGRRPKDDETHPFSRPCHGKPADQSRDLIRFETSPSLDILILNLDSLICRVGC